jgi:hypothetical protein
MLISNTLKWLDGARTLEKRSVKCSCFREPFNTISNIGFGILGLIGMVENTDERLVRLYFWMVMACFCSGFHHASPDWMRRGTLILDWVPIAVSIVLNIQYDTLQCMTLSTMFKAVIASLFLFNDLVDYIPVPWGHVTWHILAAMTIDSHYRELHYC